MRLGGSGGRSGVDLSIMKVEGGLCCVPDSCCDGQPGCFTCQDVADFHGCNGMGGSFVLGGSCSAGSCLGRVPGLCCYCSQGFYYITDNEFGDDARPLAGSSPDIQGVGNYWPTSTRVYIMSDGSSQFSYGSDPAPDGGTFHSKYVYSGSYMCAFSESIMSVKESYWYLGSQATGCSSGYTEEECLRCRGGDFVGGDFCGIWRADPFCALECCSTYTSWPLSGGVCGCDR